MPNDMSVKKIEKRTSITPVVLGVVGIAGVMAVAAIAPGALSVLAPLVKHRRRYRTPRYLEGVVGKLQKQKLIRVYYDRGEPMARLTPKGEAVLARHVLSERLRQPQKWDGKWRVVIFDIHEFKRTTRDRIRKNIAHFGFLKLQNSVWVFPYECEEIVTLLKADCRLGQELLYMAVEKIENDGWLRRKFDLKIG